VRRSAHPIRRQKDAFAVYPKSKAKSGGAAASKAEKAAEARDEVAAFLARGGQIKTMPSVVTMTFACANCGHTGTIGVAHGKAPRCPKCREPLQLP
jgi:hypothetical protein